MFCLNFDNSFVPDFIVSSSELWRASAVNTRALVAFAVLERYQRCGVCQYTVVRSLSGLSFSVFSTSLVKKQQNLKATKGQILVCFSFRWPR